MCLEKTNVIRVRWVFQNSERNKSNVEEKIIPIFSQRERRERERERVKNRARKKDHSVTYSEINNSGVNLTI